MEGSLVTKRCVRHKQFLNSKDKYEPSQAQSPRVWTFSAVPLGASLKRDLGFPLRGGINNTLACSRLEGGAKVKRDS